MSDFYYCIAPFLIFHIAGVIFNTFGAYILKVLARDEGLGRGCQSMHTVLSSVLYTDIFWNILSLFVCPTFIYHYTVKEINKEEFQGWLSPGLKYPYVYTLACTVQTLAAILLTAATYERYQNVADPFWSMAGATRMRGYIISSLALFFALASNIPRGWDWEVINSPQTEGTECWNVENVTDAVNVEMANANESHACRSVDSIQNNSLLGSINLTAWIYTTLNFIFPLFLLLGLNIGISYEIIKKNRRSIKVPADIMPTLQSVQWLGIMFAITHLPQLIKLIIHQIIKTQTSYLDYIFLVLSAFNSTVKVFLFYTFGQAFGESVRERIPFLYRKAQLLMPNTIA